MSIITHADGLKHRRTKIVATVGPASSGRQTISSLISAGVNVFRLNMSHGDHAGHARVYEHIRSAAKELNMPIGILADLCGPKIRTGLFRNDGVDLEDGAEVTITMREILGEKDIIPSQYAALAADVKTDDRILLSDGLLELQVISSVDTEVKCRVVHGGHLGNHKGINLPGIEVSAPSMTDKDYVDAEFALDLGVDFIALSFVRSAQDLEPLQQLVAAHANCVQIISKIEKPEALINADGILDASDAIMVARGDLGVELLPEEVPAAQSGLIELAKKHGKPVIVATQMLESMIEHSRPTRAEVTDVAHAVDSGVDAIMLSGETAVGAFPVKTVQTMDRIARQAEAHLWRRGEYGGKTADKTTSPLPIWNVIANATSQMSKELMVPAIMVISRSGASAATVSVARPAASIFAITDNPKIYQRMVLLWGVVPTICDNVGKTNPNQLAREVAVRLGLTSEDRYVLLVRGFHREPKLNSPSVTVITL